MEKQEQDEQTKKISNDFILKILSYAIVIERHLASIIILQFETNDAGHSNDFLEYFDKASFERKIKLVKLILNAKYPYIMEEFKETLTQIDQIRGIRNNIAHLIQSYENDSHQTSFVLSPSVIRATVKNGKFTKINVKRYTPAKMVQLMKMAEKCDSDVRRMVEQVRQTKT